MIFAYVSIQGWIVHPNIHVFCRQYMCMYIPFIYHTIRLSTHQCKRHHAFSVTGKILKGAVFLHYLHVTKYHIYGILVAALEQMSL